MTRPPVALTIAGSDPSGGAGLQADLKTFQALGVYGMAAVTMVTVQNTRGVSRVHALDAALVREQVEACVSDIPPGAVKTGALGSAAVIEAVAEVAETLACPLVVDPVMISKHGHALLDEEAEAALREVLVPLAGVLTPNRFEAARLAGMPNLPETREELLAAGERLLGMGARAVLLKGTGIGGRADDLLLDGAGVEGGGGGGGGGGGAWLEGERIVSAAQHGSGCVLAAALAAQLARGLGVREAAEAARAFTRRGLAEGAGVGTGPVRPVGIGRSLDF